MIFKKYKTFKMKDLPRAKELIEEWNKADSIRQLARTKLKEMGLNEKMISFLQNKPRVEIIEFKLNRIVYNTTEKVTPQCDWYGGDSQTMKALPDGRLQIEETEKDYP